MHKVLKKNYSIQNAGGEGVRRTGSQEVSLVVCVPDVNGFGIAGSRWAAIFSLYVAQQLFEPLLYP